MIKFGLTQIVNKICWFFSLKYNNLDYIYCKEYYQ